MSPTLAALALALPPCLASQGEHGPADPEERLLRAHRVEVSGPGLLAFFRRRSPSPADLRRLEQLVRQLGGKRFAQREQAARELTDCGPPALPLLRQALRDPDPEVARRARECVERIERGPGAALPLAALRLLARRQPPGAVQALLAYAPHADDAAVEEEVLAVLRALSGRDKEADPALAAALADPSPARRAAAAVALAGRGDKSQAAAVRRLLTDPDPRVRLRAALGLLTAGDRAAVPALIGLLRDAPAPLAWQAEEWLLRVAGERAPAAPVGAGNAEARRAAREAWDGWWRRHGAGVSLAGVDGRLAGLTVITEPEPGTVWECGPGGAARWKLQGLRGPMDARLLPGGRVLVPEIQGQRVTERDLAGKVHWEKRLPGEFPVAAQRLPGGNTFIATRQRLLEVRPDGAEAVSRSPPAGFVVIAAERLPDGHVVCLSSGGTLLELDEAGKAVRTLRLAGHAGGWGSVERLPGGHFLVAMEALPDGAREVDGAGKVVWKYALPRPGPGFATRLPGGQTLLTDASREGRRVLLVDRAGRVVWEQATPGRALRARRR